MSNIAMFHAQTAPNPFRGGAPDQLITKATPTALASADYANATVRGWRRENGRVGVRNHVVILPLDDLSNAACEAVAAHVKGTMALPHAYGRLQFGEDLEIAQSIQVWSQLTRKSVSLTRERQPNRHVVFLICCDNS